MGIIDKIKGLFKKKAPADKAAAPAKKAKGAAAKRSAQFAGEGKVADALRYAADKIDVQVAAGKYDDKRGDMFVAQLKDVEASTADDDAKLIQISQIIGGIISA